MTAKFCYLRASLSRDWVAAKRMQQRLQWPHRKMNPVSVANSVEKSLKKKKDGCKPANQQQKVFGGEKKSAFPESLYSNIQNAWFSGKTRQDKTKWGIKRNREVWPIHWKKLINRKPLCGSPSIECTRQKL